MNAQRYLVLDYETRSEADLKKIGAHDYAAHKSTEILCAGWKIGTRDQLASAPVYVWDGLHHPVNFSLKAALRNPANKIIAHNAFFEQVITKFVLGVDVPVDRWICTASMAAALALPRDLEGACAALGLKTQKDMEGRRLMLKMSKPRKATKASTAKWHESREDLTRLGQYCATDVEAETELFLTLPPLSPLERKVWELDQKINWRGFAVDRKLIAVVLGMIDRETARLNQETETLTAGMLSSTKQVAKMLEYMPPWIEDLQALTVKEALKKTNLSRLQRRLLEIRQAVSKSSTAKYAAFEMRSRFDGRVRDHLLYHGASTGRWTGRGVQPQNFPRGKIKDIETACEVLGEHDLDLVRLVYGEPMDAFASCLRGMIRSSA